MVLPGVGAFDRGADALTRTGLRETIIDRVAAGVPLLGICLGMQLLARSSEEGSLPGLGLVAADVRRLPLDGAPAVRVPHMGWNEVQVCRDTPLIPSDAGVRFYFVHSYAMVCDDDDDVLGRTIHGGPFASVVQKGSVVGAQFHPEKSHSFGMSFLEAWSGAAVEARS